MVSRNSLIMISFVTLLTLIIPLSDLAQGEDAEESKGLLGEFSIGSLKPKSEKAALALGVTLKNKLPLGKNKEFVTKDRMYHSLVPTFDISQTEDEKFERVSFGIEGFTLLGDRLIIPYAMGLEASRNFESYAGVIELGWAPGLRPKDSFVGVLQRTLFADAPPFSLQAGYKFQTATNSVDDTDLQREESGEDEKKTLIRLRLVASLNTDSFAWLDSKWFGWVLGPNADGDYIHMGAKGEASLWHSIIADEWHDVESVALEIYSPKLVSTFSWLKDKRIDFSYQWGSGAPNFNKGEFFSAALKMKL